MEVLVLSFGWLPGEREEDRKKAAETSDATREVTMDEGKTDETAIDEGKKETDAIATDNAVIETDAVTNEATSKTKDVVMSEVTDEAIKETNAVTNEANDEATKATDALVASSSQSIFYLAPCSLTINKKHTENKYRCFLHVDCRVRCWGFPF